MRSILEVFYYISVTVELTNNNPALTLHKQFLGFNLTCINIMDYQLIQSLNAIQFTLEQLEKLSHKLTNYTMVNYASFDENYAYHMPTWLVILVIVLVPS